MNGCVFYSHLAANDYLGAETLLAGPGQVEAEHVGRPGDAEITAVQRRNLPAGYHGKVDLAELYPLGLGQEGHQLGQPLPGHANGPLRR